MFDTGCGYCWHKRLVLPLLLLAMLMLAGWGARALADTPATSGGAHSLAASVFNVAVPAHAYDLLLCRPEQHAVTVSVLAYQDMEGCIGYGTQAGTYTVQTPVQPFKKDTPVEVVLGDLRADTRYYYHFRVRALGAAQYTDSPEYTFYTARAPGSTFSFTMTADAHLDEHTSAGVYLRTLGNIRADHPDFHLDLGNLFMTDKHAAREEAASQYRAQRYYLGQIATSAPVLLAQGTHDGESGRYYDGTDTCLAVWSNLIRKRYFPNPAPDAFFSGNAAPVAHCGLLQDYYAWEWGDALFVVLDPFWYTPRQHGDGDGWGWTLGQAQYQWLEHTLATSKAHYKFVFIHNLLGGNQAARGGVEVASLNEWGGKNADGSAGFAQHRPGWEAPVHQLLVRQHVSAVFKAHDNFYARQELDGIVYQMIPQPSFSGDDRMRDLENYGYKHGAFLGNSGHVRVTVAPDKVTVAYIRSCPPNEETAQRKNGEIADSYTILPWKGGTGPPPT